VSDRAVTNIDVDVDHLTIETSLVGAAAHATMRSGASGYFIRYATALDVSPLLGLMKQLAVFEGYDDQFSVTERDLLERGLAPTLSSNTSAQFTALVAASNDAHAAALLGYAVVYEIPFTFDLRPTLVLKELYVAERSRSDGVGMALMQAVHAHARARSCGRMKWDVLPNNDRAKAFYRRLGGQPVLDWEAWRLDITAP
jgi:GNAT superfamily N-acetyltransferase